jgi:hypothetical protein
VRLALMRVSVPSSCRTVSIGSVQRLVTVPVRPLARRTRVPVRTLLRSRSVHLRVADAEWEPFARGDHGPGTPDIETVVKPLGSISTRFRDAAQIAPGVTALVRPGHSAGHTSYIVTTSAGQRLIAFGDVFHIPAQLAHPRELPLVRLPGGVESATRPAARCRGPWASGSSLRLTRTSTSSSSWRDRVLRRGSL